MVGALVLSELADKFGRRTLLLWSTVLFAVSTIATSFSVNYVMFIVLRLFVAAFGSGIFLSNFVIRKYSNVRLLDSIINLFASTLLNIIPQKFNLELV